MNIFICFYIALISAIFSIFLKKTNPEISLCVAIMGIVSIFFIALNYTSEVVFKIENSTFISEDTFSIPIKILGLTIMSKLCMAICEDAGERGLSVAVSSVTKFASIFIAFPLFEQLIQLIGEVIKL